MFVEKLARFLALEADQDDRGYWIRLIGFAFLVRIIVVFAALGRLPLIADADSYSREALLILGGARDQVPYFWPPGMPYLLSVVYTFLPASLLVGRLVALVISLAHVALVAAVARQASSNRVAARLAGWLAAVYPPDVLMAGQTFSYPLTGVCVLAFVACVFAVRDRDRVGPMGGAGLALGFGVLVRPSTLASFAALPLWDLWRRGANARAGRASGMPWAQWLVVLAIAGFMVLPAVLHNGRSGGGYTISTNNEWNFFVGNNRYTHHYKTGHFGQRTLDQLPPEIARYFGELLRRNDSRPAMVAEARRFILEHPFTTAWRSLSRIRAFWGFDHTMTRQIEHALSLRAFEMGALLAIEAGGYVAAMILVLVGLWCGWDRLDAERAWFLLGIVAAFQLPYALAFASSVYHVPVMGLLLVFAGAGAQRLLALGATPPALASGDRRWALLISLVLFLLVQVEYGYYLVAVR